VKAFRRKRLSALYRPEYRSARASRKLHTRSHVEGGVRSEHSRYIALYCQEPSTYLAETSFNNLEQILENFPETVKQKYLGTWNHFSYVSSRKVNFIDRILLKKSPFSVSIRADKKSQADVTTLTFGH